MAASVRRSARVQATTVANVVAEKAKSVIPQKRSKTSQQNNATAPPTASQDSDGFKIPATPSPTKRRRPAPSAAPPPMTPTPSAVGVMISPVPRTKHTAPDNRPASPNQTNAPLKAADGSVKVVTPSRGIRAAPGLTTATLLEDGKAHLIKVDSELEDLVRSHHCKMFDPEGLTEEIDPFSALSSGIMAQQVSGSAARSIKNKFIGLFPASGTHPGPPTFPPPEIVAVTSIEKLRTAGLSQRKAEYIQGLAEKFASGELTAEMLGKANDEEVMEKLVAVRGLGKWSVEMFMMFGLKRMDVFSTGDLGVARGMAVYKGRDVAKLKNKQGKWKYMAEQEMLEVAEPFRPYRSLFLWYMWRIEDPRGQSTNVEGLENNAVK